jgi:hypothetical protein
MCYLLPWPVTQRRRHRMVKLGSGDASRIICSSLIAQPFEAVRYAIPPKITRDFIVVKPHARARLQL